MSVSSHLTHGIGAMDAVLLNKLTKSNIPTFDMHSAMATTDLGCAPPSSLSGYPGLYAGVP
eukprot:3093264-Pyramimonas_sp.AAC.1